MPETFAYKVRDQAGKVIEGQLEADNVALVAGKLREMGYVPISIERQAGGSFNKQLKIPGLGGKIKLTDLAVFTRQFATMISSGLSLLRSLTILSEQTDNKELARIVGEVRLDVERGSSLSIAMAKHEKAFNRLYVAMVRSGETGGSLDEVMLRAADTIEKQAELRRKVKSAMTYPAVVAVMVLLIVSAMLIFVVPMFETMYAGLGGTLPVPTQILLVFSRSLVKFWYLFFGSIVGGTVAFKKWKKTEEGRKRWDAIKLRLPIMGQLTRKIALARFSRTLSALTRSGVPILEALEIVRDTAGNEVVSHAISETSRSVKAGESISKPLERFPVFPPMVVQMMAVGEETGALDTMLDKIADFYDSEVEATVEALTSLIEPLLMVFMGLTVGGMVIALYMPMFQIINLVK